MKKSIAIVFATTHGTTEMVAYELITRIGEDRAMAINLKNVKKVDLSQFNNVIIGGSIHAGKLNSRVTTFCNENLVDLLQKKVSLFICGMNHSQMDAQLTNAFPALLFSHATKKLSVGGEFRFNRMNFFEKLIVRKIAGIKESQSQINHNAIIELVNTTN